MADCAFNTKFSRRAMLAGGGAAVAAPALANPPCPDPDAELLRLMAEAERCWAAYEAARPAFRRAFDAMVAHPDYPNMTTLPTVTDAVRAGWADLARRTGYAAAAECREAAHARYMSATRAAFDTPALTLRGLCAKMRFAVTVAAECLEPCDSDWLRRAMADLERLAVAHG